MDLAIDVTLEAVTHESRPSYELPFDDLQGLSELEPINIARLTEQCLGNLSLGLALVEKLTDTFPKRLAELDAAVAREDFKAISAIAHSLKGVTGMFAANALMEVCADLESAGAANNLACASALIQNLRCECQRAIEFLPTIHARLRWNSESVGNGLDVSVHP